MSLSPLSQSRFIPVEPLPLSRRHVSEHGETLSGIAERLGMPPGILAEANPHVLNVEESMYPGTVLEVPEVSAWGSGPMLPDSGEAPPQVSNKSEVSGTGSMDDSGASVGGKGSQSTTTTTTHADGSTTSATSGTNGNASVDSDGNASAAGGASHSSTTTAANGSSTTVGSSASGSVSVGDGTTTVSAGGEATASAKTKGGSGISFKVGATATASSGTTTENGTTTYTVSGDVSVSAEGGATVKVGAVTLGGSAGHTVGSKTSYTVSVPEEAAQSVDPASVNPYDPASMPAGTKVTMNGADYAETELAGTFGTSAAQISFGNKTYTAEGTSTQIEKLDDHTVRVTIGPTEVVGRSDTLGVSVLGTGLSLGTSFTSNSADLKTATFDLSTPEGKAAYENYLAGGELPDDNGAGVSDVATIAVLDTESTRSLSLSLFGNEMTLSQASSTASVVQTTYPDGTSTVTAVNESDDPSSAKMTATLELDSSGEVIPSRSTFTYSVVVGPNTDPSRYAAAFGLPAGSIQTGQQLTIEMTFDQMEAMQKDFEAMLAEEVLEGDVSYGARDQLRQICENSTDVFAFAAKMAAGSLPYLLSEAGITRVRGVENRHTLAGTVEVDGVVVKSDFLPAWGTPMEML